MKALSPRQALFLCLVFLVPCRLPGELPAPVPQPVSGALMPTLSPDGNQIAFVYRGDIWLGSAHGGRATQLTDNIELDAYPLFSPDGKWIACSSRRTGNWDIFLVPVEGGPVQQLTYHSGADIATGWAPDGSHLLFAAKRDTVNFALFSLDVLTLRETKLWEDFDTINSAHYSPDGRQIVFDRNGFPWSRPRYVGSGASQIWLLNPATGQHRTVASDQRQHLWTQFYPDNRHLLTVTIGEATPSVSNLHQTILKFLDNSRRTPNLWRFDLEGHGQPLTHFIGGSVRFPTVAQRSGDIAFCYDGDLWLLAHGKKEPTRLTFTAARDEKQNPRRRETLTTGVTEAEPSPDGKTFAFGLRGDIWTVPIEKPKGVAGRSADIARRLTDWAGDDSDFSWSQDGKKLYFTSDRQFNVRLYALDLGNLKVTPLWNRDDDVAHPMVSPDGKQLGFWAYGAEGGLYHYHIATGETRRLVRVPGAQWNAGDFAWSPDMQWVAYSQRGEEQAWNIWIVRATGGEPVNVTRLNAQHSQPTWSPDGKYLFFQSNRDGDGLYVLPLTRELARNSDLDIKFQKPKGRVEVKIDFDDLTRRIRKFAPQNPQADLTISGDGLILFISDGDIWSVSYDGKETKRLTNGGGKAALRVATDGKKIFYLANGELWTMKPDGGDQTKTTFTADWERDVRAERLAAFTQFWRSYNRGFYDPNFHGRNWDAIRRRYQPRLAEVDTPDEFALLLQMMVGELEASHSEVTPTAINVTSPVTPHLGFTFDYGYQGPGIKVKEVPAGAPGSYPETQIKPGEYVLAINGQDVTLDEHLYQWINDKQDRELEFLVNGKPTRDGARTVRYQVLSQDEWNNLVNRNRVERLRRYVESRSGGRIGYLHLSAMGYNNQTQFEREAYEYILGKEAMIIDVRFNGGGNISDTLIEWLDRKQHGFYRPRDSAPEPSPARAWNKPIVVLMNEHSFSNAEMFPYAMREQHLAKLVGMPTPGYVIWTEPLRLVDGTMARLPESGVYRLDGTPQENIGEKPDVQVDLSPEDWLAGRDPQLDKAIELLE
ncbi:MAG: PD40 domain-containing protein [Verrucomicrobia bacterium]|nr:PD40 domain-containing protein [Verrucomicrobiota bacterium]